MKVTKILPVIGVALFVCIIWAVGIENIVSSLINADPVLIAASIMLLFPHLLLQTYKWRIILSKQRIETGIMPLLKIYMIGIFYGILTPGKIGTLIRVAYLKEKTGKNLAECSSSVIIDRILDVLSMFILALFGVIILIRYLSGMFLLIIIVIFLCLFASFAFLMKKKVSRKILRFIYKVAVPLKFKNSARMAFHSFYRNLPNSRGLLVPFFLTLASWIISYTSIYFVALSIGINVPYHIFITIFPIATIIGLIPITVGGWGTREATLIMMFSLFAIAPGAILTMSIMSFIITGVIPAFIGAILALGKVINK